jgi:hypothetical protein
MTLPPRHKIHETLALVQARRRSHRVRPELLDAFLDDVKRDVRTAKRAGVSYVYRKLTGGTPPPNGTTTTIHATWTARKGWAILIQRTEQA